jgi:hypothetical protein
MVSVPLCLHRLAMTIMSAAEFLLSAVLGFLFWKKGLHRRFPGDGATICVAGGIHSGAVAAAARAITASLGTT